jgi:ABC-type Fe3+-citrate transport system substrate-binding protein
MYHRTQNENGTYDSRCLDCFLTIAFSVNSEDELERREEQHLCPEKVLARIYAAQRSAEAHCAVN